MSLARLGLPWGPAVLPRLFSERSLTIADICSTVSSDTCGDGATSVVAASLVDGADAELLVAMLGDFTLATVLVDAIGGACCLVMPSTVKAASVVDLVCAESLGTDSLVVLDAGLATWSSVVFPGSHGEPASAIAPVLALFGPSTCLVARIGLSMDFCAFFAAVMSRFEAFGFGAAISLDLVSTWKFVFVELTATARLERSAGGAALDLVPTMVEVM